MEKNENIYRKDVQGNLKYIDGILVTLYPVQRLLISYPL